MVDYARMAEVASRLIQNNGRPVTFIKISEVPADPTRPWIGTSEEEETVLLNAVFVPPSALRNFGLPSLGQGVGYSEGVEFSEQIAIVAQGDLDLNDYSQILDGGVRWGINSVQILRPANTNVIGFVGVRR